MPKVHDPYFVSPTPMAIAYPASYRDEHGQIWPSAGKPIRGTEVVTCLKWDVSLP